MNIVLYTRDMEPITIIDLPMWAVEIGERQRMVAVELMDPVRMAQPSDMSEDPRLMARTVWLDFHPIRFYDQKSWLITVENEELALLLKPSWLPGQRKMINDYERKVKNLTLNLLQALSALAGRGGH